MVDHVDIHIGIDAGKTLTSGFEKFRLGGRESIVNEMTEAP